MVAELPCGARHAPRPSVGVPELGTSYLLLPGVHPRQNSWGKASLGVPCISIPCGGNKLKISGDWDRRELEMGTAGSPALNHMSGGTETRGRAVPGCPESDIGDGYWHCHKRLPRRVAGCVVTECLRVVLQPWYSGGSESRGSVMRTRVLSREASSTSHGSQGSGN